MLIYEMWMEVFISFHSPLELKSHELNKTAFEI